MLDEYKTSDRF
jgi:hypothetical protein